MASANVKSHESRNKVPHGNVGAAPDLSDVFPEEAASQSAVAVAEPPAGNGSPRLQEFVEAAKPVPQAPKKPIAPPPVAEVGQFSQLLGAEVFYWRERDVDGVKKLMPIPGKLVRQSVVDPGKWRVLIFLDTGNISNYNEVCQSDTPKLNCFTLKK